MSDTHTQKSTTVVEVLIRGPQGPSGVGTDNIGGYSVAVDSIDVDHVLAFNGSTWHNKPFAGGGDMTKAVYDSKNDGKVDIARAAETVAWSGITSVPTSFTPATHAHVISDITGLSDALDDKASSDDLTALTTAVNEKAALASPEFTGTPKAPTATSGTNTTQIATTAFVTSAIAAITPGGITWTDISDKPTTFTPSTHTHAISDITSLSTVLDAKAALASPTLTGTPAAPTASAGTNTTQIATTAFVTTATTKNVAIITTSGNFTVPAGIRSLDVQLWGGGGGGAGGSSGKPAGGGGGGGYCCGTLSVTPGQVIAAVIGAAGTAGSTDTAGGSGGTTTFSALSATGGKNGSPAVAGSGGVGGAGSGGTINLTGGAGSSVIVGATSMGGSGGASPLGGGGSNASWSSGYGGQTPGGGGSGRGGIDSGSGSAGAPGLIIITY